MAAFAPVGYAQEIVDSLDIYDPEALEQIAVEAPAARAATTDAFATVDTAASAATTFPATEPSIGSAAASPIESTALVRADSLVRAMTAARERRSAMVAQLQRKGGRLVEHTVQRGEDLESIATYYGVTPDDILTFNPLEPIFYTGMTLEVPTYTSDAKLRERELLTTNSLYLTAAAQAKQGKYGDAIKGYSQLIEQLPSPPLALYYNRGLAQYNRDKLRQAMEDFAYVKSHDSNGDFPDAANYYRRASEIQAQRDAENAEMWGNLAATLITTATVAVAAHEAEKQHHSGKGGSGASSSSGGYSSSGTTSYSSSSSSSDSSSSQSRGRRCQKTTAGDNAHCNGSGVCQRCNGEGKYHDYAFGLDTFVDPCKTCGGSGKCPSCGGDGWR